MNKCNAIGILLILTTTAALAGPDVIIRERAKQLRDQNNARQGVPPPTPPAQRPATPAPPATASTIATAPAPQPGLARLQANLAAIKTNSIVSADQKQRLTQDLMATAQGPAKPSPATAGKLAADLAAAFAEKPLSTTDRSRIAQNLNAVLNPGNIPSAQMEEIVADVQSVLQKRGVSQLVAGTVAADLKAVLAESRKTTRR